MREHGNWKIVDDDEGVTYIKVIDFPVPPGCEVGGESMWVKIAEGGDNAGKGTLCNEPAFCDEVEHGDLVEYGGGTEDKKPQYRGKVKAS